MFSPSVSFWTGLVANAWFTLWIVAPEYSLVQWVCASLRMDFDSDNQPIKCSQTGAVGQGTKDVLAAHLNCFVSLVGFTRVVIFFILLPRVVAEMFCQSSAMSWLPKVAEFSKAAFSMTLERHYG